jgi:hypothetical protein
MMRLGASKAALFAAGLFLAIPAFAQTDSSASDRLTAAAQIHAVQKTIRAFEASCRKWSSPASGDIAKARSVWEHQHAAVLGAVKRALATATAQQRAELDAALDKQNLAMQKQVESAPSEERDRLCADFAGNIASPTMDPDNSPAYQKLMK